MSAPAHNSPGVAGRNIYSGRGTTMDETGKRRISIERMAAIWRWATGDGEVKDLAFGDVDELKFNCDTFAEFIELNKDGVQLYEAGEAP